MNKFKDNLKKIRMANTLSQLELAKRAGIEATHISHYECGRRMPNVHNLKKLSTTLNCTMEELLNED